MGKQKRHLRTSKTGKRFVAGRGGDPGMIFKKTRKFKKGELVNEEDVLGNVLDYCEFGKVPDPKNPEMVFVDRDFEITIKTKYSKEDVAELRKRR